MTSPIQSLRRRTRTCESTVWDSAPVLYHQLLNNHNYHLFTGTKLSLRWLFLGCVSGLKWMRTSEYYQIKCSWRVPTIFKGKEAEAKLVFYFPYTFQLFLIWGRPLGAERRDSKTQTGDIRTSFVSQSKGLFWSSWQVFSSQSQNPFVINWC